MLARGMVAKRSRWHTILLDSVLITEEHDQLPATELLRHFVLPVIQLPYEPGVELVLAPALLNEEDQLRWRRFHRRSSSLVGAEGGEVGVPLSPSALAKPLPPDSEVSEEGDDDGPLPKYITTTKLICPSDWEVLELYFVLLPMSLQHSSFVWIRGCRCGSLDVTCSCSLGNGVGNAHLSSLV